MCQTHVVKTPGERGFLLYYGWGCLQMHTYPPCVSWVLQPHHGVDHMLPWAGPAAREVSSFHRFPTTALGGFGVCSGGRASLAPTPPHSCNNNPLHWGGPRAALWAKIHPCLINISSCCQTYWQQMDGWLLQEGFKVTKTHHQVFLYT